MKLIHTKKLFELSVPTETKIIDWYNDGTIKLTRASSNELVAIRIDGACEWYNKTKEHQCTCLEVY